MKKVLTLFFAVIAFLQGFAQNEPVESANKPVKFFFGLNYDYLQADMKLLSMSKHSVWDNQDLGVIDLSQDEIDTINSYMDYTEKVHNATLMAGMVLLNKPGSPWYLDGHISFGFVSRDNILLNHSSDSADVEIRSEQYSPSFGLGFNFKYLFSEKWGLTLGVRSLYASGTSNEIDERIYPEVSFLEESKDNRYRMSYSMAGLMVSYSFNKITLEAGPGFYFFYNRNEYHIVRSDAENGTEYEDDIKTALRSDMFINGCLRAGWRISDHFKISAAAGVGKDISANAALIYFL